MVTFTELRVTVLQDPSRYLGRSQECCGLDDLYLYLNPEFPWYCSEGSAWYWYHCHLDILSFFFFCLLFFFFFFLWLGPGINPTSFILLSFHFTLWSAEIVNIIIIIIINSINVFIIIVILFITLKPFDKLLYWFFFYPEYWWSFMFLL